MSKGAEIHGLYQEVRVQLPWLRAHMQVTSSSDSS